MAGKVFNKVKGTVHGVTSITEVQQITLDESGSEEILAKGDDDLFHDGQAIKTRVVTGSITTRNSELGKLDGTLVGGANQGTLVFIEVSETTAGANQEHTLSNCMLFPPVLTADSDGEGNTLVYNFRCVSSDGQTSPVAQADE